MTEAFSTPTLGPFFSRPRDAISKTTEAEEAPTIHFETYDQAMAVVDRAADHPNNIHKANLYAAVHFLEHFSFKLYDTPAAQQALWQRAHGSFALVLSTGSAQSHDFHPPPKFLPFSYAMIDDTHFGNGIGSDAQHIWISMLQKHHYEPVHRRMVVTLKDIYFRGKKVTDKVPGWMKRKLHVGMQPDEFTEAPPPTFVIIAASDKALVARGNQSGGLAIWARLQDDIRPVAYQRD